MQPYSRSAIKQEDLHSEEFTPENPVEESPETLKRKEVLAELLYELDEETYQSTNMIVTDYSLENFSLIAKKYKEYSEEYPEFDLSRNFYRFLSDVEHAFNNGREMEWYDDMGYLEYSRYEAEHTEVLAELRELVNIAGIAPQSLSKNDNPENQVQRLLTYDPKPLTNLVVALADQPELLDEIIEDIGHKKWTLPTIKAEVIVRTAPAEIVEKVIHSRLLDLETLNDDYNHEVVDALGLVYEVLQRNGSDLPAAPTPIIRDKLQSYVSYQISMGDVKALSKAAEAQKNYGYLFAESLDVELKDEDVNNFLTHTFSAFADPYRSKPSSAEIAAVRGFIKERIDDNPALATKFVTTSLLEEYTSGQGRSPITMKSALVEFCDEVLGRPLASLPNVEDGYAKAATEGCVSVGYYGARSYARDFAEAFEIDVKFPIHRLVTKALEESYDGYQVRAFIERNLPDLAGTYDLKERLEPQTKKVLLEAVIKTGSGWAFEDNLFYALDTLGFDRTDSELKGTIKGALVSRRAEGIETTLQVAERMGIQFEDDDFQVMFERGLELLNYELNPETLGGLIKLRDLHPAIELDAASYNVIWNSALRKSGVNSRYLGNLRKLHSEKPELDEGRTAEIHEKLLESTNIDVLKYLQENFGSKPDITDPIIAQKVKDCVLNITGQLGGRGWRDLDLGYFADAFGGALHYSTEERAQLALEIVQADPSKLELLHDVITSIVDSKPEYAQVAFQIQRRYMELLTDEIDAPGRVSLLEQVTGIKPEWDVDRIRRIYKDGFRSSYYNYGLDRIRRVYAVTHTTIEDDAPNSTLSGAKSAFSSALSAFKYSDLEMVLQLLGNNKLNWKKEDTDDFLRNHLPFFTDSEEIIKPISFLVSKKLIADKSGVLDTTMKEWARSASYSPESVRLVELATKEFDLPFEELDNSFKEKYFAWLAVGNVPGTLEYYKETYPDVVLGATFLGEIRRIMTRYIHGRDEKGLDMLTSLEQNFPDQFVQIREDLRAQIKESLRFSQVDALEKVVVFCEKLYPDPEERKELFRKALDERSFFNPMDRLRIYARLGIEVGDIGGSIGTQFMSDPVSTAKFLQALKSSLPPDTFRSISKQPWSKVVLEIMRMQPLPESTNSHDPWKHQLEPFNSSLKADHVIDYTNPLHAQAYLQFIKKYGIVNLPTLFETYLDLQTNDTGNNISEKSKRRLAEIGIETSEKTSCKELMQKLEDFHLSSRALLIRDSLPRNMDSELGLALYQQIRGYSTFLESNYSSREVLGKVKTISETSPETYAVPSFMSAHTYQVKLKPKKRDQALAEDVIEHYFTDPDSSKVPLGVEVYSKGLDYLSRVVKAGSTLEDAKLKIASALEARLDGVYKLLGLTSEEVDLLAALSPSELASEINSRLQTAPAGTKLPKEALARNSQLKSILELRAVAEELNDPVASYRRTLSKELPEMTKKKTNLEKEVASIQAKNGDASRQLEEISRLSNDISIAENVLFRLAVSDSQDDFEDVAYLEILEKNKRLFDPSLYREALVNYFLSKQSPQFRESLVRLAINAEMPEITDLKTFKQLMEDHGREHFLFQEGDVANRISHNGRYPFRSALSATYLQSLGLAVDPKTGQNPLDKLIVMIEAEEASLTSKPSTMPITMVPVGGIGLVMAPYAGDMCASKQDMHLARGDHPDLRAYLYVSNYGTPTEQVVGSVFSIITEDLKGNKVLVIRGNNPRMGFLDQVDSTDLLKHVVTQYVEDADRYKEELGPDFAGSVKVSLPMDQSGSSSTNRPAIREAVSRVLGDNLPKTDLRADTGTRFNNYDNTVGSSYTGTGVVYSTGSNKSERVWYGTENYLHIGDGTEWGTPYLSLAQLDGNKGREINGIAPAQVNFRVLPAEVLTEVEVNPNVIAVVPPSNYAMFIDPVGQEGANLKTLTVQAPHWRSITEPATSAITIKVKGREVQMNEVNVKGCGYTKPTAKNINLAAYSTWFYNKPGDETNNGVRFLGAMLEWSDYVDQTTRLAEAGLRCEMGWATYKPNALPYRGRMRDLAWLRQNKVIPDIEDSDPYLIVRLLKTNTRVEEALRSENRQADIIEDAITKFNLERKFNGQPEIDMESPDASIEYMLNFSSNMGSNMAVLHNLGNVHTALHGSNVSMLAEIMDVDTVAPLEDYEEDKPELLETLDDIPYGFLQDVIDAVSSIKNLETALNNNDNYTPTSSNLSDAFKLAYETLLTPEVLASYKVNRETLIKWVGWISDAILVSGVNSRTLKNTDFDKWASLTAN